MKKMLLLIVLPLLIAGQHPAIAAPPAVITYQGYLASASGAPITTPVAMSLSLYASPTGGTPLWSENQPTVPVVNGVYSIVLGSITPINLPFNTVYYLGVAIGSDPEVTPRQELTTVPYSFRAISADKLNQSCADGEILRYSSASSSWSCAVAVGPQGVAGTTGAIGAQGAQGVTGATGATGAVGTQGVQGIQGVAGVNGSNGLDGKSVLNGTVDPLAATGVNGDFYINTASNSIFGPKAAGVWPVGVALVGPAGATGATGTQGIQGVAGATGTTGAQGIQGIAGTPGTTGAQGIQGIAGTTGAAGASPFTLNASDAVYTAGSLGVGISPPDASALLDLSSTAKGLLTPRMTSAQRIAITSPANGLIVYDTDLKALFVYDSIGSVWNKVQHADTTNATNITSGTLATTQLPALTGDVTTTAGSAATTVALVGGASAANVASGANAANAASSTNTISTIVKRDASGNFSAGTITANLTGNVSGTAANVTGIVAITNGGTGATTQALAAINILPSQAGNTGKMLGTDGTNPSWVSVPTATYRWATFSTFEQNIGWAWSNSPDLFGGVTPDTWTYGSGSASMMSSDKEVLRTLYTNKGYAKKNAMIMYDNWYSVNSADAKIVTALFRISNTTASPINWTPCFYFTAYSGWGELATVALNGVSAFTANDSGSTCATGVPPSLSLAIPAGRVSTVIFVSASGVASGNVRNTRLAFYGDTLALPVGLSFVDDLDTAVGGWEQ